MSQGTKTLGGIIAVLLVVAGGTYYLSHKDKTASPPSTVGQEESNGSVLGEEAVVINAKHSFANGKHIIAGEVDVPTPCYSLNTTSSVSAGKPQQVEISFVTTDGGGICAQVISARRFKIEFTAGEDAVIHATLNGKNANLNLIPVGPGEDLNNFDIYIKG